MMMIYLEAEAERKMFGYVQSADAVMQGLFMQDAPSTKAEMRSLQSVEQKQVSFEIE